MNSYSIVQLVTFFIYAILIAAVLLYSKTRLKKLFVIFLVASAGWSFVSIFANLPSNWEQAVFFGKLVSPFLMWSLAAYAHFIAAFLRRGVGTVVKLGYGLLLSVIVLVILGYCPREFILLENVIVYKDYGYSMYLIGAGGSALLMITAVNLIKGLRAANDPENKNRITYLLAGVSLLIVSGMIWKIMPHLPAIAIDHTGNLGNALIITYAILRYQLVDIKLVIRKSMVYSGITASVTATFLLLLFGFNYLLRTSWSTPIGLVTTVVMVFVLACLFNPLRGALEKGADRLFYGSRYDYRQMVLKFASQMSNVIDLDELARAMLRPITNAVGASQASLLFASDGYFSAEYAERLLPGEPVIPVHLRRESPIVNWLQREDQPLHCETIYTSFEFKGMWQEERNTLDAAEIELLCPIKSKHKLIAILALSKKQPRGHYYRDDTDLLMILSHEAAVAIENAQLYARAKQRANTDELTGLFNHRYFHERLDEEIARCSRFGYIFSLLFFDLDNFKKYNDVYGHLSGDKVLQYIGQQIDQSVRAIDICFRYGGDEFAILLPETPLDGASRVAERIRKGVEAHTELKGAPQTCSIGIASWPTDGVMREEIIRSADAALYFAKQTGGNTTCWACEVALSEVLRIEAEYSSQNSTAILNTIYALAATVDAKDHHTYGHSKKVSRYATEIAERLGYSREEVENICAAALLHDIGKIGISDQLLAKREPLDYDDWEAIRAHPGLGVSILKHVDSLKGCLAAVQYHHERYDGTGYPAGLKGNNIPIDARVLSVADAFDAMTSERPYRLGRATKAQALEELQRCSGTQFDPQIVKVFTELYSGLPKRASRTS